MNMSEAEAWHWLSEAYAAQAFTVDAAPPFLHPEVDQCSICIAAGLMEKAGLVSRNTANQIRHTAQRPYYAFRWTTLGPRGWTLRRDFCRAQFRRLLEGGAPC